MHHFSLSFCVGLFLATALGAEEPLFTFVKSETTTKHIAVQPKEEHHRIYFPIRIENAAGQTAFARVRCKPEKDEGETLQTVHFKIKDTKELWRVYIRAPRHESQSATYQVEVGVVDSGLVDPEVVLGAFAWQVQRDRAGRATFVTQLPNPEGGTVPVRLPVVNRRALVVGGSVKIVSETTYFSQAPDLVFGLDEGPGREASVVGSGAWKVKE